LQSVAGIFERYVLFSPFEKDNGIENEGNNEVNEYAANNDEKALPSRF